MTLERLSNNRAVQMLQAASRGKYGVLGVVSYNMETVVACIRAAEAKRAPLQILLFPWALKYSTLFVDFCAHAARRAKVPVTLHMDHAQDPEVIKQASAILAADGTPAFDSIMVDMSHYEKTENLAKTKDLVAWCHARGISTEAEPGRIEGGEDGVQDTAELKGMMTTEEEVDDFVATGIDFLAPAFGNVHGEYGGRENIEKALDYDRLDAVQAKVGGRVLVVMHGTNGFPPDITQKCIDHGVTRINVNKLVLSGYFDYIEKNTGKVPQTTLIEQATDIIQKQCEEWMDIIGCSGKA